VDPAMVRGIIAGGAPALQRSQEDAEDNASDAQRAVDDVDASERDVVMGIAASGTTPFVGAALEHAQHRGARTVLLTCTDPPGALRQTCDVTIVVPVGPEVLTGSTRLKAGTATKLVLNTVTTGAMIRSGKAYGNLMVDLMALSEKLRDRGERIVMEICRVNRETAQRAIRDAGASVKLAIVMVRCGVDAGAARRLLDDADGVVRAVVGEPPEVLS
jgi:N-acetylmuramic acid 6-phosphate etherase